MEPTEIGDQILVLRKEVAELCEKYGRSDQPCLVAVSKLKPKEDVMSAYDAGQRHFGENYVQELCDKAEALPKDIQWHFIGHLQSKKCKILLSKVPHLFAVEGVDSEKLAKKLDGACESAGVSGLRVFVQVNTSAEASKSGCEPEKCVDLAGFILEKCKNLRLFGLMTIGKLGDVSPKYFAVLAKCREEVCCRFELPPTALALSMGMTSDFPLAVRAPLAPLMSLQIEHGSTNIRVGTRIFGKRPPKLTKE